MTASPAERRTAEPIAGRLAARRPGATRRGRSAALILALALAAAAGGCTGHTPVPTEKLLEPLPARGAIAPSDVDRAAARLARAALAAGPAPSSARDAMLAALSDLEAAEIAEREDQRAWDQEQRGTRRPVGPMARAQEAERRRELAETTNVVPLAQDLVNATCDDPRTYREASEKLLGEPGLDPALEERLQRTVDDDPLRLAQRRILDDWSRQFAHHFNAVSEPLGRSLLGGVLMAPYQIATTALHWFLGIFEGDSFSVQERQALVLRQEFLRMYPDDPEAPRVRAEVEKGERQLDELYRDRYLEKARDALDARQPLLAIAQAERALAHVPGDEDAQRVVAIARSVDDQHWRERERSLGSREGPLDDLALDPERARRTAIALWTAPHAVFAQARDLGRAHRDDPLDDEAAYLVALAQEESGREDASWEGVRRIARHNPEQSNMARHASALSGSAWQNPYAAWEREREEGTRRAMAHEVFGTWANGPRYRFLPPFLGYLVDLPSVVRTALLTPIRSALGYFRGRPDFYEPASVAGYRYLGRYPDGEHSREVLDWLIDHEESRENWEAALRLADFQPDFDPERRATWVENAAERRLDVAAQLKRRDERGTVLRSIVLEYPDSSAGHQAGLQARAQVEHASAQRIRMTRAFLVENRAIAGPAGLGLRDALLDGQRANGELHPDGISFLGGRMIEFNLLPESGKEDDAPVRVRQPVSAERLARAVALVDEAALRNARVDVDDQQKPDAQRDRYFERARLGLTGVIDPRPTAESTYVYQGVQERYGVVRGRDSVLPFDLVFQGSLEELSFGAFPRWRAPKETPDAFLYR